MGRLTYIGASASGRSVNVENNRFLNCYAEIVESKGGKTALAAYGTPGLRVFTSLPGQGPIRDVKATSTGRVFAVQGAGVYEIFSDASSQLIPGSLLTQTGPVHSAENGQELVWVDGPNGYFLTFATGPSVTRIVSPNFYGADRVVFIDQYLIFNRPGTTQFYISDLLAVTFQGLDFASKEGSPDRLVSIIAFNRDLWLLGQTSSEVWINTGAVAFPFERAQGAFIETGTVAAQSVVKFNNALYWLDGDERGYGMVWQAVGYQVTRISTHPVEYQWSTYARIDDAFAYSYEQEGHLFYVITFPTGNATWAYDVMTGLWHERGYMDPATRLMGRHRSSSHTFAFGLHLVGDYQNGNIYVLDLNTFTDNGTALPSEIIFPPGFDGNRLARVAYSRFQVDMETGVGLDGGVIPGTTPAVMLQTSNDGGHSWGNELWRDAGQIGATKRRALWHQLGQARDRRFKVRVTDPVKRVFLSAFVDADVLRN